MRLPASQYQIAIPSFGRPGRLAVKTLTMLMEGGVDLKRVTVFVSDHDPAVHTYKDILQDMGVGRLDISPTRGITAVRRHLVNQYPEGTPVLQLDDDISQLKIAFRGDLRRLNDVHSLIIEGFTRTAETGLYAWGVCPVANAFYLDDTGKWTDGLRFLIGTFLGEYVRPGHPVHHPRVTLKEDYEISLRHWWYDGGVMRAAGIAVVADHYTPGGVAAYRNTEAEQRACDTLIHDWPGFVRMNTKRKTPEILLATKGRTTAHPITVPPPGLG